MGDDAVDCAFGTVEDSFGFGSVATFEHGAVGVGHEHREVGVDGTAQGFLEKADSIARRAARGKHSVGIVVAVELQLSCKTVDHSGDAPEIDGEDESDGLAIVGDGGGDVVGNEGDGVAEDFG